MAENPKIREAMTAEIASLVKSGMPTQQAEALGRRAAERAQRAHDGDRRPMPPTPRRD